MKKLGIVFAVAMGLGGCMAGDEELATSTASVELDAFTEEAVAARLGAGWTRVEAGVLERRGDDGSVQRVAVGRRGLDADVARFRAELYRLETSLERPATAAAEEYVQALRTRVARLEAMQVEKDTRAGASYCTNGTAFFAESTSTYDSSGASLTVTSGWGSGVVPRVPSQAYAYVGVWDGWWFPVDSDERFGDSYNPARADRFWSLSSSGCVLSAYAWVSPDCPEGYLSFSDHATCSPNPF